MGSGMTPAERDALSRSIEASAVTSAVTAANDVVRPVLAHTMAIEAQVRGRQEGLRLGGGRAR